MMRTKCIYRTAISDGGMGFLNCAHARYSCGSCVPEWDYPRFAAARDAAAPDDRAWADKPLDFREKRPYVQP